MIDSFTKRLLTLNQLGLIPGPGESLHCFIERAEYCLDLKHHLTDQIKANFQANECYDPEILNPASSALSQIYDICPIWIPLFFSNYRLPFWHGGCAWIFQVSAKKPLGALIQLRKTLKYFPTYLKIYSRQELLIHEMTHIGRMAFQEPIFEEVLAYRTAKSSFRKYYGPIIQSSTESAIFLLIIVFVIVFDVFLLSLSRSEAWVIGWAIKSLALGFIIYALIRLWRRNTKFNACFNNLRNFLPNSSKTLAVMYRLTDQEIFSFSKLSQEGIKQYAIKQAEEELRWKIIIQAYFYSF